MFRPCRSGHSSVPESHYKSGIPTQCENFNPLSQFSHSLLQGFFSYLAYMYQATSRLPCVRIRPGSVLIFFLLIFKIIFNAIKFMKSCTKTLTT